MLDVDEEVNRELYDGISSSLEISVESKSGVRVARDVALGHAIKQRGEQIPRADLTREVLTHCARYQAAI